jgi:hypothetical protein
VRQHWHECEKGNAMEKRKLENSDFEITPIGINTREAVSPGF